MQSEWSRNLTSWIKQHTFLLLNFKRFPLFQTIHFSRFDSNSQKLAHEVRRVNICFKSVGLAVILMDGGLPTGTANLEICLTGHTDSMNYTEPTNPLYRILPSSILFMHSF
jgi:hypothetical protein